MGIEELLASIPVSSEKDLREMLKTEMRGLARPYVMERIYGRFSMLRKQRERREMAEASLK